MNDCYFDKKDWRACRKEVRFGPNQMGPELRFPQIIIQRLPPRKSDRIRTC